MFPPKNSTYLKIEKHLWFDVTLPTFENLVTVVFSLKICSHKIYSTVVIQVWKFYRLNPESVLLVRIRIRSFWCGSGVGPFDADPDRHSAHYTRLFFRESTLTGPSSKHENEYIYICKTVLRLVIRCKGLFDFCVI